MTTKPKKKYDTTNRPRRTRTLRVRMSEEEWGRLVELAGGADVSAWIRIQIMARKKKE